MERVTTAGRCVLCHRERVVMVGFWGKTKLRLHVLIKFIGIEGPFCIRFFFFVCYVTCGSAAVERNHMHSYTSIHANGGLQSQTD